MDVVTASSSARTFFIALFATLIGFTGPAFAQVNVESVGCAEEKSGTPFSIQTTKDVAAGNALIVAAVNENSTGTFIVDIDDGSKSQTLSREYSYTGSTFDGHFVHADFDAQAWPSGSTITLNPNTASPSDRASLCAIEVSGLASSNVIGVTTGDFNASLNENMSSTAVSTSQPDVLLLGVHHWVQNEQKATPTATGFSVAAENDNGTNTNDSDVEGNLMLATRQVSSTGSYATEAILESQDFWNASILALKVQTNTAPTVATNNGSTVDEGTDDPITQSELETTDPEQGPSSLTYTIDTDVTEGDLFVSGTQVDQGGTFTQADINSGTVEFRHDGTEPETGVSFDFTVRDGQGGSTSGTFGFTINPVNDAPTISSISDQTIQEDGTLSSLSFAVGDAETSDLSTISLSGSSDNTTLVPDANIGFTGPDASGNASITVQPASNESGTATITVTADDGSATSSESFVLTVEVVPDLEITDGGSSNLDFSGSVSPGTDDNPVGIFELMAGQSGASFDAVTVTNKDPGVSGISAVRLYWSSDQTLEPGSDTELDEVTTNASSAPSTIAFSGFTQSIPTSARYAILAIDVQDGASADVQFELAGDGDLSTPDGEIATVNGTSQSSFSALPLSNSSTALPVELATFEARQASAESVTLRWETLSETNNADFEVQRRAVEFAPESTQASWQSIATVEGAGTTDEPQVYQFEDAGLPYAADSLTYRLRQVDTDGTASYSDPVTIARPVAQAELLPSYPNPARGQATIRYAVPKPQAVRIELYDLLGRRVQTVVNAEAEGRTEQVLDTSRLGSGTYFLRMQTAGYTETQRLTVVR